MNHSVASLQLPSTLSAASSAMSALISNLGSTIAPMGILLIFGDGLITTELLTSFRNWSSLFEADQYGNVGAGVFGAFLIRAFFTVVIILIVRSKVMHPNTAGIVSKVALFVAITASIFSIWTFSHPTATKMTMCAYLGLLLNMVYAYFYNSLVSEARSRREPVPHAPLDPEIPMNAW